MVYILSLKAAFVEVPKTASRSVCEVIHDHYGNESGALEAHHATLAQYFKKYPDLEYGVCVFREPFCRLTSALNFMYAMNSGIGSDCKDKTLFLTDCLGRLSASITSKQYDESILWLYPQYSFLSAHAPVYFFPISNLQAVCAFLGINKTVPRKNVSLQIFSPEEVLAVFSHDFIRHVYDVDFVMWDKISTCASDAFFVLDAKVLIDTIKNEGTTQ
jgi:hypothetical protein